MSSLTSPIAAQHPSPDPCPEEVRALELRLADYLPEAQVLKVRRAYEIGAAAHAGQLRKSGEAYITHPVAVAGILADLRMDAETLCAAILHDALDFVDELLVDLAGGDLAQRHHGRLVLVLGVVEGRLDAGRQLAGALGGHQDQLEAVLDDVQAIFDGDACHAESPGAGWPVAMPRKINGLRGTGHYTRSLLRLPHTYHHP